MEQSSSAVKQPATNITPGRGLLEEKKPSDEFSFLAKYREDPWNLLPYTSFGMEDIIDSDNAEIAALGGVLIPQNSEDIKHRYKLPEELEFSFRLGRSFSDNSAQIWLKKLRLRIRLVNPALNREQVDKALQSVVHAKVNNIILIARIEEEAASRAVEEAKMVSKGRSVVDMLEDQERQFAEEPIDLNQDDLRRMGWGTLFGRGIDDREKSNSGFRHTQGQPVTSTPGRHPHEPLTAVIDDVHQPSSNHHVGNTKTSASARSTELRQQGSSKHSEQNKSPASTTSQAYAQPVAQYLTRPAPLTMDNLAALSGDFSDEMDSRASQQRKNHGMTGGYEDNYQDSNKTTQGMMQTHAGPSKQQSPDARASSSRKENSNRQPTRLSAESQEKKSHVRPYKDVFESSSESSGAESDEIIKPDKRRAERTGDAAHNNKYICHYPKCPHNVPDKGFKTKSALNQHKIMYHDVCQICNLEFANFNALLMHKQMDPAHIACWVCGLDFHTPTARERHMLSNHPRLKNLECPGCGQPFSTSPAFIGHVERNACQGISDEQFNKARLMISRMKESIQADDPSQINPYKSFSSQRKKVLDAGNRNDFPELPNTSIGSNTGAQRFDQPNASVKHSSANPSISSKHMPLNPAASDADNYWFNNSAGNSNKANDFDTDELNSEGNIVGHLEKMSLEQPEAALAADSHEKRLLEMYRKMVKIETPQPPKNVHDQIVFEGIPGHYQYSPTYFRTKFGTYKCPHKFCYKPFQSARALDAHLRSPKHAGREFRCPECHTRFHSAQAIIAHMTDANAECDIKHSPMFKEAMEVASGAFLTASHDTFGKLTIETQEPDWSR